jgi:hypothetical protein
VAIFAKGKQPLVIYTAFGTPIAAKFVFYLTTIEKTGQIMPGI